MAPGKPIYTAFQLESSKFKEHLDDYHPNLYSAVLATIATPVDLGVGMSTFQVRLPGDRGGYNLNSLLNHRYHPPAPSAAICTVINQVLDLRQSHSALRILTCERGFRISIVALEEGRGEEGWYGTR